MGSWLARLLLLGVSLIVLYSIQKYLEFRRVVQPVHSYPRLTNLLSQRTIIANILPRIPGLTRGRDTPWIDKHKPFADAGFDATINASFLPTPSMIISLADAAAIKEVTTARARFPKPVEVYQSLSFFGDNIVVSEGEEWKRYRKIAAPAFNEKNNKLIWDETLRIMQELFDDVWGPKDTVVIDHALHITISVTLFVLSAAAFGRRISWKDEEVPPGHDMSFKDAIHEVSAGAIIKVLVPKWAMGLTAYTRRVRLAYEELDKHMLEMIALRRNAEKKEEKSDLFTNLLDASADDPTFTVRDLTGNIFMFLVAGHETTGHTLCFTLALLALYPDQQEILYQHIKSIIPDGRLPGYEEMSQFTQSMAVFYETLRMFPSVNVVPKHSAEDTSLTLDNAAGEKYILPIPQGTHLAISIVGMHYNPRYWKDPEEFRPARFLDPDWPRDAFLPFSGGPRACIGRRFAEIEAVATLTMLVSKYKIEVKEEPQFANETFEQRKARVLASKPGLTMTPIRAPLVFKRR